ncbi:hypothetical protein DDQ68_06715 [Hymenobacter nivis]|uniref:Uncharacterized protein n=1 Tax=Hymenobacter nivis TaxID=1850093 RepID=A0A2Z3GNG1_9BACT|nr:hypothetical protein DDQ68_06715 [Hymenobacter nivis]
MAVWLRGQVLDHYTGEPLRGPAGFEPAHLLINYFLAFGRGPSFIPAARFLSGAVLVFTRLVIRY